MPLIIAPSSVVSPTSYIYTIPILPLPAKPFSHLTIFLLPGITLPPSTAAAVYLALPQTPTVFRFLGAIGLNKESAVFRVSGLHETQNPSTYGVTANSTVTSIAEIEVDMDAPEEVAAKILPDTSSAGILTIGISIESTEAVAAQMATLQDSSISKLNPTVPTSGTASQALVLAEKPKPDTLLLAQRIIKDAFNYLTSFSSSDIRGELVPLKAFEEWWRKFEAKVKRDPSFLEKDELA
ncbi:Bgt-2021 [Blumeria graminis f. sp. tritici]|uniref:Bgt-2021 n=3 Tax=Blumeria graminis TaxID=34373 RepID=A0A9X9PQH1_BLUGR|nr:hypothetical protein BGT96224_2021 [Blumeria graminis f. sp. tritici 96224]VCU39207.1 Bgt-2021 [Blumeria graminis f. sp. tritici]